MAAGTDGCSPFRIAECGENDVASRGRRGYERCWTPNMYVFGLCLVVAVLTGHTGWPNMSWPALGGRQSLRHELGRGVAGHSQGQELRSTQSVEREASGQAWLCGALSIKIVNEAGNLTRVEAESAYMTNHVGGIDDSTNKTRTAWVPSILVLKERGEDQREMWKTCASLLTRVSGFVPNRDPNEGNELQQFQMVVNLADPELRYVKHPAFPGTYWDRHAQRLLWPGLRPGDRVVWTDSNIDIPQGTVGVVTSSRRIPSYMMELSWNIVTVQFPRAGNQSLAGMEAGEPNYSFIEYEILESQLRLAEGWPTMSTTDSVSIQVDSSTTELVEMSSTSATTVQGSSSTSEQANVVEANSTTVQAKSTVSTESLATTAPVATTTELRRASDGAVFGCEEWNGQEWWYRPDAVWKSKKAECFSDIAAWPWPEPQGRQEACAAVVSLFEPGDWVFWNLSLASEDDRSAIGRELFDTTAAGVRGGILGKVFPFGLGDTTGFGGLVYVQFGVWAARTMNYHEGVMFGPGGRPLAALTKAEDPCRKLGTDYHRNLDALCEVPFGSFLLNSVLFVTQGRNITVKVVNKVSWEAPCSEPKPGTIFSLHRKLSDPFLQIDPPEVFCGLQVRDDDRDDVVMLAEGMMVVVLEDVCLGGEGQCEARCSCQHGAASNDCSDGMQEKCLTCDPGYGRENPVYGRDTNDAGGRCWKICGCSRGAPADECMPEQLLNSDYKKFKNEAELPENCKSCHDGYELRDGRCQEASVVEWMESIAADPSSPEVCCELTPAGIRPGISFVHAGTAERCTVQGLEMLWNSRGSQHEQRVMGECGGASFSWNLHDLKRDSKLVCEFRRMVATMSSTDSVSTQASSSQVQTSATSATMVQGSLSTSELANVVKATSTTVQVTSTTSTTSQASTTLASTTTEPWMPRESEICREFEYDDFERLSATGQREAWLKGYLKFRSKTELDPSVSSDLFSRWSRRKDAVIDGKKCTVQEYKIHNNNSILLHCEGSEIWISEHQVKRQNPQVCAEVLDFRSCFPAGQDTKWNASHFLREGNVTRVKTAEVCEILCQGSTDCSSWHWLPSGVSGECYVFSLPVDGQIPWPIRGQGGRAGSCGDQARAGRSGIERVRQLMTEMGESPGEPIWMWSEAVVRWILSSPWQEWTSRKQVVSRLQWCAAKAVARETAEDINHHSYEVAPQAASLQQVFERMCHFLSGPTHVREYRGHYKRVTSDGPRGSGVFTYRVVSDGPRAVIDVFLNQRPFRVCQSLRPAHSQANSVKPFAEHDRFRLEVSWKTEDGVAVVDKEYNRGRFWPGQSIWYGDPMSRDPYLKSRSDGILVDRVQASVCFEVNQPGRLARDLRIMRHLSDLVYYSLNPPDGEDSINTKLTAFLVEGGDEELANRTLCIKNGLNPEERCRRTECTGASCGKAWCSSGNVQVDVVAAAEQWEAEETRSRFAVHLADPAAILKKFSDPNTWRSFSNQALKKGRHNYTLEVKSAVNMTRISGNRPVVHPEPEDVTWTSTKLPVAREETWMPEATGAVIAEHVSEKCLMFSSPVGHVQFEVPRQIGTVKLQLTLDSHAGRADHDVVVDV